MRFCHTWIVGFVSCVCIMKLYVPLYVLSDLTNFDGGYSHQPLETHWWLWMSLGVGPQHLMDRLLRKCLLWDCICFLAVSVFMIDFLTCFVL